MSGFRDETARIRELLELDRSLLPPDGGDRFNRLIFEASPYLLQHAENPVAWYAWGDEAFAAARQEDKPLFLSIGYATCHWCHVMAHESFEDREVAELLNRNFIPVKVDREERPDIDDQCMLVAQMMTGRGGWPLTVIMSPDRQPFFTATYLPKTSRAGMPGLMELLANIGTLWQTRRDLVEKNCAAVMEGLAVQNRGNGPAGPVAGLPAAAWEQLRRTYDPEWGGFGGAPKFPMPQYLSFLILYGVRTGEAGALRMAEQSLEMMRRGGIFDQIGYGVHRYSVDRRWLVPHFEKMLYDQALIAGVCLELFRAAGSDGALRMAEEILAGVAAELTAADGGFFSALDADSEGEEGKYYLWTPDELREVLGEEDARLCGRLFGVTPGGNFEGRSILHLTSGDLEIRPGHWRQLLLERRARRIPPLRDEKILTAWNGLMIAALADAYAVTGRDEYLDTAVRAVDVIRDRLVTPEGRLLRSRHGGRHGAPAFLEDYAFFVRGLIALHQATLQERFLATALHLTDEMLRLFADPDDDRLSDTGCDVAPPLIRLKGITDGVIPSGNAVAALNLIRLGRIAGREGYVERGRMIVAACSGSMARVPVNHLCLLAALDLLEYGAIEITFSGAPEGAAALGMLRCIHRSYLPGVILRTAPGRQGGVSVCAAGTCHRPVDTVAELELVLAGVRRDAGPGHG